VSTMSTKYTLESAAAVACILIELLDTLVRVHAVSINPVDYKVAQGSLALVLRRPPWVPGYG